MTRQRDVEFSDLIQEHLPLLYEGILNVGHRQTRNRGTVGGSLCQLDPSAEIPTVSLAFDALMVVASKDEKKEIPAHKFFAGYMSPELQDDEMLIGVNYEIWPKGHGYGFTEFARREGDFAIASVAILLTLSEEQVIERINIALGGIANTPLRFTQCEKLLKGKKINDGLIDEAADLCFELETVGDALVPSWYRQHLASVLFKKTIRKALSRANYQLEKENGKAILN